MASPHRPCECCGDIVLWHSRCLSLLVRLPTLFRSGAHVAVFHIHTWQGFFNFKLWIEGGPTLTPWSR